MKSQMNFCAHHHHPKPQTGKSGCGFGVWACRNDPSTSPKRCHCISAWPCICSVINEGKIPVWAVPIPKPIWFVCGWEGRRDLEPPARSGTPERLGSMKEDLCKSAEKGNHYFGCLSIPKKKKKKKSQSRLKSAHCSIYPVYWNVSQITEPGNPGSFPRRRNHSLARNTHQDSVLPAVWFRTFAPAPSFF